MTSSSCSALRKSKDGTYGTDVTYGIPVRREDTFPKNTASPKTSMRWHRSDSAPVYILLSTVDSLGAAAPKSSPSETPSEAPGEHPLQFASSRCVNWLSIDESA